MLSNNQSSQQPYVLGHTPEEIQRLQRQGQMLYPFTRRLFEDAGITKGMKVLDVGCGPGEVSLLAAELVGEEGSVLGVDSNADVLRLAQARAQAASLRQVSFLSQDIHNLALSRDFDAVVGRLILMHLPDPVAILRLLAKHLRPGGLLVFQEYDFSSAVDATQPPCSLSGQMWTWCAEAFRQAGVELGMGMKLYSIFLQAGLPAPQLRYEAAIGGGPEWMGYEVWADVIRTLLPVILKFDIATAEEIDIETLTERLREEIVGQGAVLRSPVLISAWTHSL